MAFRGNVFQGQVSNPGVGSGIQAITASNFALQSLINNQANNRNQLLNSALGIGGKVFADNINNDELMKRQNDQQAADVDLLKMKLPFENATKQASLLNAARQARDNGDEATAQRLEALANQYGQASMGSSVFGSQEAGGEPSPVVPQPSSPTSFQPVPSTTPASNVGVGEEFTLPGAEPFSGFGGSFTAQKNQAEVAKKTTDAQTAKINLNNVQGLQQAINLPDGTTIKDSTGTGFINLKMNEVTRGLLKEGADLRANNPDEVAKQETAIASSEGVFDLIGEKISIIEKNAGIPKTRSTNGLEAAGKSLGNMFFETPLQGVNRTMVALQGNPKFEKAFTASSELKSTINGIAKKLQDGGVVTAEDAAQAAALVPSFAELSKEDLMAKKTDLANLLIRPTIEQSFKFGNALRYNKAQKLYKNLTGDFYSIGGDVESQSPQRNSAPIVENNIVDDSKFEIGGPGSIPFSQMGLRELTEIDESTLTPEDQKLFFLRLKEIRNGR